MASIDISVVICTHNRSSKLQAALLSLAEMDQVEEAAWEVIVVDNDSKDDTCEVVCTIGEETSMDLEYVFEGEPGLANARNRGVRQARGRIVAFLDDDVRVQEAWLRNLQRQFATEDAACIGGPAILAFEHPRPAWWISDYEGIVGHFHRGPEKRLSTRRDVGLPVIGANVAFRRTVFEDYGLFRTDLGRKPGCLAMGEETELVHRLLDAGQTVTYVPDVVVYHYPGDERFSKQYLRRWYTSFGGWECVDDRLRRIEAKRVLGVPRWKFREAAVDIVKLAGSWLFRRPRAAFYAELRLRVFLGYLKAASRGRTETGVQPVNTAERVRRAGPKDPPIGG